MIYNCVSYFHNVRWNYVKVDDVVIKNTWQCLQIEQSESYDVSLHDPKMHTALFKQCVMCHIATQNVNLASLNKSIINLKLSKSSNKWILLIPPLHFASVQTLVSYKYKQWSKVSLRLIIPWDKNLWFFHRPN